MVTWVPGHSVCTASASTWAASWRISSSARGSSRLTNSILASRSIGSARSASVAVERHGDGALGERRRDALGDFEAGDAVGVVPTRAVGKGQRDHIELLVAHSLPTNAGKRAVRHIPAPPLRQRVRRSSHGTASARVGLGLNAAEVAKQFRQKITFRSNVRAPIEENLNPSAPGKKQYEVRAGTAGRPSQPNVCADCRAFMARGVHHGCMPAAATSAACVCLRRVGSVGCRSVLHGPPARLVAVGIDGACRECARPMPMLSLSSGAGRVVK